MSGRSFLAVCDGGSANYYETYTGGGFTAHAEFIAPSVSLSGNTLHVSCGKLRVNHSGTYNWGGGSNTINLNTKVYYN